MADEKKPPQEVAPQENTSAEISINISLAGESYVTATCWGLPDSSYPLTSDRQLLSRTLPIVLAELREQLRLGRRLSQDESDAIACDIRADAKDALLVAEGNLLAFQLERIAGIKTLHGTDGGS